MEVPLYTERYFFKISESGSLKGQNQPARKRKKSEVLIEEASLINLSNDNKDSKKDRKCKKHFIPQYLWAFCSFFHFGTQCFGGY